MKRSFTILLVTLCIGLPICANEQPKGLPKQSQALVAQLEAWEKDENFRHQLKLEQKRKEVSAVLDKHMKEATASGEIDAAVRIRDAIQRLSKGISSTQSLERVVGLWDWWGGSQFLFIRSDGTGFLTTKPARQVQLKVIDGRYYLLNIEGEENYELVPRGEDEIEIKAPHNSWKGKRIKLKP